MTETLISSPAIYITPYAKQKMDLYITLCKDEISGFGTVSSSHLEEGFLLIDNVFIFEQECSGSHSDMSSEDVSKFIVEAVNNGIDPGNIKIFWHSHANSGVFWSGTDNNCIEELSDSWLISIVGNHKGQYLTRLDIFNLGRITIDELRLVIAHEENDSLKEQIEKEIKEKVSKSKTVFVQPKYAGYNTAWQEKNSNWNEVYQQKKLEEIRERRNESDQRQDYYENYYIW
jgi:proteasome lid subunit RPN8/RPN11